MRGQFTEGSKEHRADPEQRITKVGFGTPIRPYAPAKVPSSCCRTLSSLQNAFAVKRKNTILYLAIGFGVVGTAVLTLIAFCFLADARRRAADSEAENKAKPGNYFAALNEMGDLADGDLTIRAKVTGTSRVPSRFDELHDRRIAYLGVGVSTASSRKLSVKSQQAPGRAATPRCRRKTVRKEIPGTCNERRAGRCETLTRVSATPKKAPGVLRSLAAADKGPCRRAGFDLGE